MRRIENNKIKFYLLNFHMADAFACYVWGSDKFPASLAYEARKFSENLSTTEL
jgi:hypothetical protein